jgi:hypothetical protein
MEPDGGADAEPFPAASRYYLIRLCPAQPPQD